MNSVIFNRITAWNSYIFVISLFFLNSAVADENDLWKIEAPAEAKSASIGQKKAATLRTRLKHPAVSPKIKKEQNVARIYWIAPEKTSDSYVLSFSADPTNLKNQVNIPATKLKTIEDPVHGKLLGYALSLKTKSKKIFYRLQAEKSGNFSKKSPVTELLLQDK